jgi:hypothetical protein
LINRCTCGCRWKVCHFSKGKLELDAERSKRSSVEFSTLKIPITVDRATRKPNKACLPTLPASLPINSYVWDFTPRTSGLR